MVRRRKVGIPDVPSGEANTRFSDSLANVTANVPAVVIGEPETEKMLGIVKPTKVTPPLPLPVPQGDPVDVKFPSTSVPTHSLATAPGKVVAMPAELG